MTTLDLRARPLGLARDAASVPSEPNGPTSTAGGASDRAPAVTVHRTPSQCHLSSIGNHSGSGPGAVGLSVATIVDQSSLSAASADPAAIAAAGLETILVVRQARRFTDALPQAVGRLRDILRGGRDVTPSDVEQLSALLSRYLGSPAP